MADSRGPLWSLAILLLVAGTADAGTTVRARDPRWLIDNWVDDESLPSIFTAATARTPDGYVWMATLNGLGRFDGTHFLQVYPPELPSRRLVELEADSDGALWIVSENGHLIRYADGQVRVWEAGRGLPAPAAHLRRSAGELWLLTDAAPVRILRDGPEVTSARSALRDPWSVARGREGAVWVGSQANGLVKTTLDGQVDRRCPGAQPCQASAQVVHRDPAGVVWLGNGSGLWREQAEGWEQAIAAPELPALGPICSILDAGRGDLLLNSLHGWWRFGRAGLVHLPSSPRPSCIPPMWAAVDGETIWYSDPSGIYRDGIRLLDLPTPRPELRVDADHVLWLADGNRGLFRIRPAMARAYELLPPQGKATITSVLIDPAGTRWFTARNLGILRVDPSGSTVINPDGFSDAPFALILNCLLRLRSGAIWAGSDAGVCAVEGDRCRRVELGLDPAKLEGVGAMYEDHLGRIWLGTSAGLWIGEPTPAGFRWTQPEPLRIDQRFADPAGAPRVRVIIEQPRGVVWLGTNGAGLWRYADGRFQAIRKADGLGSDFVFALHVDDDGVAWAGTDLGGLCRIPPSGTGPVKCLGSGDGLPLDSINSVTRDGQGALWLSGPGWITRLLPDELEAWARGDAQGVSPLRFNEAQGLNKDTIYGANQPSVSRDLEGRLWYPTWKGAAEILPLPPLSTPTVRIDRVRAGAKDVTAGGGRVELTPEVQSLSVAWSSPQPDWPGQVRFRYRLRGFDDAWTGPTAESEARWTGLPPGEFTLEVAAGLGGLWGEPARRTVRRAPSFRESALFPASLSLLGMSIIGGAAWLRSRSLRWRQRELEAEVVRRTEELVFKNAEIAAQSARLLEVDRLKTRFVANLSHELRTPLTLMAGPLEGIDEHVPPDVARRLGIARANIDRLETLIDQMFDITRLDAGSVPLRVGRHELGGFLRRLFERFADAAGYRKIEATLSVPEAGVVLYFDPDLIDKVVSNLLSNALKFTGEGGRIALRLEAPASGDFGDGFVRVTVSDTGIGIPEQEQARVFERFYQVERDDNRRFGGTGIGLALARELVELHGGEVSVRSVPGQGAAFSFTLPTGVGHLRLEEIDTSIHGASSSALRGASSVLHVAGPSVLHGEAFSVLDGEAGPSVLHGEAGSVLDGEASSSTMPGAAASSMASGALAQEVEEDDPRPIALIVEDHPDMRAFLVECLSGAFRTLEAENGADALEKARQTRPAVIVSDVMMPVMDGLELCRRLRDDEALAPVPIMLVSAKASEADRLAGLELADDYLTKPFRMVELIGRITRLARRRGPPGMERVERERPDSAVRDEGIDPAGADSSGETPYEEDMDAPAALSEADRRFLEKLEETVRAHLSDSGFGIEQMARATALSRRQLLREVRRLTDQTPIDYLRARRLDHARQLLERGTFTTVAEVAAAVGMARTYFYRAYQCWYGRSPSEDMAPR